ncbi:MAG: phytanoyl-CoA dioxygenase family protein [Pseudomonadota bacterium]
MDKALNRNPTFYSAEACELTEFATLTQQRVDPDEVPHAAETPNNIPVYDMAKLAPKLDDTSERRALMGEWAQILKAGAGVFVLRSAYSDTGAVDAATGLFNRIIAEEKATDRSDADHFATAGSNDRIWNSLQKLCEADPEVFLLYHGNASVDAACEAWLGPNYQMTAQVNVVHPGGSAQQAHRDYHLGFQTAEISAQYPAHVHDLSPLLTLQGGIVHVDSPLESGPTKLLPFSQLYRPGYAAWRREDFRAYFEEHYVQLPMKKGDALFFNPALFHAAGANTSTDIHRMVNLLQISSAFGRAMETIDRTKMCKLTLSHLKRLVSTAKLGGLSLDAAIAATAEGYSFPTNLDNDPPVGGLAPQTQAALLKEAVTGVWPEDRFLSELDAQNARKLS